MSNRITRPTLAELWRILVACLENVVGAKEAPLVARSLAIAALQGRSARAFGVGVERRGEDVLVTCPGRSYPRVQAQTRSQGSTRPLAAYRRRMLLTR